MNEMVVRGLSGTMYVAIIAALLLLPVPYGPAILGALLLGLSLRELSALFPNQRNVIQILAALAASILAAHFNPWAGWTAALTSVLLLWYLRTGQPLPASGWIMPAVYLAPAVATYTNLMLFHDHEASALIFAVFAMLWTNDTFAYLGGKAWGKRRLWPSVSPKKSWEGLLVGMMATMALGSFWHQITGWLQPWWVGLALATVVSIFGNLGDLLESRMKRQLGVKDSGNLIPGHGGILDRIDSFLLALPAAYLCWVTLV